MPRISAGLLAYRIVDSRIEVLLVHPGGPLWQNRDAGVWSIPKGELTADENDLAAARREFEEETGIAAVGPFVALGEARQKSGKLVRAWACPGDYDVATFRSNTFEMEWPPRSGKYCRFPEVDRAAYFSFETAREKLNPAQVAFIDRLARVLETGIPPHPSR